MVPTSLLFPPQHLAEGSRHLAIRMAAAVHFHANRHNNSLVLTQ